MSKLTAVRYEAEASDPTTVWRIVTATSHKADETSYKLDGVQRRLGDLEKQLTGMQNQMNRMEILVQRIVNSQRRTTEPALGRCTLEGNFKYPSTGFSVVATGWDQDPLPCSSLASPTWNHQNPSQEPILVRQWPQNPKEHLSQPHSQYKARQGNANPSNKRVLSVSTVDDDLSPSVNLKIEQMEQIKVKANLCTVDCHNVDRKLHQILDMTEDEAHSHMKQGAFLYNLKAHTLPKIHHCYFIRLPLEYCKFSSLDSYEFSACKFNNPKHRHYVILSKNIISAFVVMNSTVSRSKKYFNDESVPALEMKIKKLMPMDDESRRLTDWMEKGVYDALQKKYLKTLLFCICEKEEGLMIEEYSFTCSYPNTSGEEVAMNFSRTGSKENGTTFKSNAAEVTFNQMRSSVCKMIRTLASLMRTLDQMSEELTAQVREWICSRDIGTVNVSDVPSNFPETLSTANYDMLGYMEQNLHHIYKALDEMVDKEGPVMLNPEFVMCDTTLHLEPLLTFSSDGFKIEYLDWDSCEDDFASEHWSLIVICYLGEVETFEDGDTKISAQVPCILHMDSLKGSHNGLKYIIQSYLWEEWKERYLESASVNSDKFLNLRFVSLELPQQDNSFDCGLFLLHYVELFLRDAPSSFNPLKIAEEKGEKSGNAMFTWHGNYSTSEQQQWAAEVAEFLKPGVAVKHCKEGTESSTFWFSFGGKQSYTNKNATQDTIVRKPHLYGFLVRNGRLEVNEIFNFSQDDLLTEDMMILDIHGEVFIWIGQCMESKEKLKAFDIGQSKDKSEKNRATGYSENENSSQLCKVEKLNFEPPPIYCSPCGARIKRHWGERQDRAKLSQKSFDEVPGADGLVDRVISPVDKKLENLEGVKVCLFGMYVQEFGAECAFPNQHWVYL